MSDNSLYLISNPLRMYLSGCDEKLLRIKELSYQSSDHFTPLTLKADTDKPLPVHHFPWNVPRALWELLGSAVIVLTLRAGSPPQRNSRLAVIDKRYQTKKTKNKAKGTTWEDSCKCEDGKRNRGGQRVREGGSVSGCVCATARLSDPCRARFVPPMKPGTSSWQQDRHFSTPRMSRSTAILFVLPLPPVLELSTLPAVFAFPCPCLSDLRLCLESVHAGPVAVRKRQDSVPKR